MSADVTLTIDGQQVTVPSGTLIIRAAEMIGTYIPRFCDHPLLDPLGACRQCLVEVEGQRKPLTACTTVVTEGMVVSTHLTSELARDGQRGVLELLLINHPLDCPMCDKGGECPLQDQALEYGPGDSRYVDVKRRFIKPIPISPQIKLDRERCVLCARCTRFADQISGDPFIELFERGALEQVAISEEEPYDSIFSGNVVQICPVGALTATSYRFRARPFDVVTTPSTCTRCASGCSIDVQHRRGELVRVLAREDRDVNDAWLCDKGRFAYAYANQPARVTEPLVKKGDEFVAVSWAEALATINEAIAEARGRGASVGVLAGQTLQDEDAYALSRFARTVLGTNDVDARRHAGSSEDDGMLAALPSARTATNRDIDGARVILLAGLDLQQESPIVFLRVRKAARAGAHVIEIGPRRTALAGAGATWVPCRPGGEAGLLVALARAIDESGAGGLDPWTRAAIHDAAAIAAAAEVDRPRAEQIAAGLRSAEGHVVFLAGDALASVPGATSLGWNLMVALGGTFGWVPRKAGARAAVAAGLHPTLLPFGRSVTEAGDRALIEQVWGQTVPSTPGRDAAALLARTEELGLLYLVGADPIADFDDERLAMRGIEHARFIVSHDMFLTETSSRANVVLPVATAYESSGTMTSWEGRARAVRAVVPPPGLAQTDAEILAALAAAAGIDFPRTREALREEMARLSVERAPARALSIPDLAPLAAADELSLVVVPMLIDDGSMMLGADELQATMQSPTITLHPEDARARGIEAGDTVSISTYRGSLTGRLRTDVGIARGAVVIPRRFGDQRASALLGANLATTAVTVERAR